MEKLLYVKPGAESESDQYPVERYTTCRKSTLIPRRKGGQAVVPHWRGQGWIGLPVHVYTQTGGLSVNEHGELEAETALGMVRFTKPVAYQEIDGKRVVVAVEYRIQERSEKHISHKDTKNTKEGIPVGMDKPCLSAFGRKRGAEI